MSQKIVLNGKSYIGSKDASKLVGYSYDYVSRLARQGVVQAEKIGNNWFVDPKSLEDFAKNQKINTVVRSKQLSQQVSGAMGTANKSAGLANAQAMLTNPVAGSMASAIKTGSTTDNSLRMQSIANSSTMTAFGSGMSAMHMANRLVALITATSLVFGLYAFTDKQYAHFAKAQLNDVGAAMADVAFNTPERTRAALSKISAEFNTLAAQPSSYTASTALALSGFTGGFFNALARNTTSATDSIVAGSVRGLSIVTSNWFGGAMGNTVVRIGVQELPEVESRMRALVAQREFAAQYNAELPRSKRVVVGGGSPPVPVVQVATIAAQRGLPTANTIVRTVETRRETVREVVPTAVLKDLVAEALSGNVVDEQALRNSLRTELLGIVSSRSSAPRVSNYGALSLSQRIDNLSGATITNSPISGSTGAFTALSVSGATSLSGLTADDLTLSGSLTVAGTTTLATTTITNLTVTDAVITNATTTNFAITGTLTDGSGAVGGAGEVLTSTGTSTQWQPTSALSVGNADTLDGLDSLDFLQKTELDTEAELEAQLTDVTNVFTDNDQITTANIALDTLIADDIAADAIGASELAASGVTAGVYGTTTILPILTIDEDGRVTSVASTTITVTKSSITNSGTLAFDWADSDVADTLTISGGTIDNTPIGATGASTAIFTNATTTGTLSVGGALSALSATITNALSAASATISGTLTALTGAFTNLTATTATTTDLVATNSATLATTTATVLTATNLTATTAAFTNTTSGNLTLTNLANGTTTDVVLVRDASNVVKVISMNDVGRTTFSGLDDTALATLADADMVLYDTATGTWRNKTLSGDATITDQGVITISANAVGSGEITDGSVANGDLANSSVSYGGVTLSLGASDATPAFNLIDATGLPIDSGTTGTLPSSRIADDYLKNTGDTATGDYNFDSNTFVVDSSTNRIGIGTTTPDYKLDVEGTFGASGNAILGGTLTVAAQCVTADTRLRRRRKKKKGEKADKEKGEWEDDEYIYDEVMIKDVMAGDMVASMSQKTGEMVWSEVVEQMNMGKQDIYKLVTQTGREIKTTNNHPYFVRTKYANKQEIENQKSYRFEVDQSIRFEEYEKDSFVAIANTEANAVVKISKKQKQLLRDSLKSQYPKELAPSAFAMLVVESLSALGKAVHELVIDAEYSSHEDTISAIIKLHYPLVQIHFAQVGKKSPAHKAAYGAFIGSKYYTGITNSNSNAEQTKNALQAVLYGHKYSAHLSLQALSITSSLHNSDKSVKVNCLTKDGEWRRVQDLKKNQMIAVTYGSHIVWEKVKEISKLPNQETVYDVEIAGTRNFIGNNIVAHNTYLTNLTAGGVVQAAGGTGLLSVGTLGASSITADSLDFTEFKDAMAVDATTTFDLDTAGADLNFDSNTLFIDSSANRVGIGTAAPEAALQVYRSVDNSAVNSGTALYGAIPDVVIENQSDVVGSFSMLRFEGYQGIDGTYIQSLNQGNNATDLVFGERGYFGQNDTKEYLRIKAGGNIGIGDTSPAYQLTVGNGDLFGVNSAGAIAAATGITSSGTITFSGLGLGLVHSNASGVLSSSAVDLASSDVTGVLPSANVADNFLRNDADDTTTGTITAAGFTTTGTLSAATTTLGTTTVTGNIAVSGTVDGRDVAADGTALDTIVANNSTDVTLAGALNYLTIVGQTITRNAIDLAADVTGILPDANISDTLTIGSSSTVADGALSANVSLLGNTIEGTEITDGSVDISTDTNLAAGTNITLSGDTLNVDDAFLLNTGDTATGDYNFDSNTFVVDSVNNRVGIGTASPSGKLSVVGLANDTISAVFINPYINSSGGNLRAVLAIADVIGTNNTNNVTGVLTTGRNISTGTLISAYGVNAAVAKIVTGPIIDAYALYAQISNNNAVGAITNAYGLYIDDSIETGVITNDYGVYQVDTAAANYFGGNLGIGDTTPAYQLTVGNGDLFGVNSAGAIAAATGITSSGTITFSGLGLGLVHSNASGVLTSSAVDLASSDVTGVLPSANVADNFLRNDADDTTTGDITINNAVPKLRLDTDGGTNYADIYANASGYLYLNPTGGRVYVGTSKYLFDDSVATGALRTNSKFAAEDISVGYNSSTDDDYIYFDRDGQSLKWNNAANQFDLSNDLSLTGTLAAATGITSSGNITFSGLTAGGVVQAAGGTGLLSVGTLGASSITADSLDFTEFKDALTLDASTDIAVTGTNVLSVTNTGTGNSFRVNDAASDTTPFVIDASGNVGVGTATPNYKLEINGTAKLGGTTYLGSDGLLSFSPDIGGGEAGIIIQGNAGKGVLIRGNATGSDFIVKSNGNIGIGDTTPDHKLDVAGNIGLDASGYINWGDTDGTAGYGFRDNAGTLEFKNSAGSWAAFGSGGSSLFTDGGTATYLTSLTDDVAFGGTGSTAPFFFDEGAEILTLTNSTAGNSFRVNDDGTATDTTPFVIDASGNVGVGTSAPARLLDLDVGSTADTGYELSHSGGTTSAKWTVTNPGINNDVIFGAVSNNGLNIITNDTSRLSILSSGNVGIGDTTPGSKLDVAGDINISDTAQGYKIGDKNVLYAHNTTRNTHIGIDALASASLTGSANTATGYGALFTNTTGYNNTASGLYTMFNNTSGFNNTAYGAFALNKNQTGSHNVAIGYSAGYSSGAGDNISSSYSIFIGESSRPLASADQNEIVIGYNTTGIGSNTVTLGNDSILTTALKGNVGIGTTTPTDKLHVNGSAVFESWIAGSSGTGAFSIYGDRESSSGLTIKDSGNVGIGTTAPISQLDVAASVPVLVANTTAFGAASTGTGFGIYHSAPGRNTGYSWKMRSSIQSGGASASEYQTDHLIFEGRATPTDTTLTERMRITPAGNVGIGTVSPGALLEVSGANALMRFENTSSPRTWATGSSGSTSYFIQDVTGGNIPFVINAGASDSSLVIGSTGNVGIGTTAPGAKLNVKGVTVLAGPIAASSSGGGYASALDVRYAGGGSEYGIDFLPEANGANALSFFNAAGGAVGSISNTATATSFNTTSDRRVKENIVPTASGLSTLLQIPISDFNFIGDSASTQQGFIAQELYALYPYAVATNGDNGVDTLSATSSPWQVDYGRLTPLLVKSIQDLDLKVSDLSLATGTSTTTGESQVFIDRVVAVVTNWFTGIGITITDTLAKFNNLAAAAFTVGSSEKPSGITLYDEITGQPYCVKIQGGAMVHTSGVCTTAITTTAASTPVLAVPTISILGNNPATITLNSSYSDLGASATAPGPSGQAVSTSVYTFFNNTQTDAVSVDTATSSVQYVDYIAVNGDVYTTSTRVVLIGDAAIANATTTLEVLLSARSTVDWQSLVTQIPAYGQAVTTGGDTTTTATTTATSTQETTQSQGTASSTATTTATTTDQVSTSTTTATTTNATTTATTTSSTATTTATTTPDAAQGTASSTATTTTATTTTQQ